MLDRRAQPGLQRLAARRRDRVDGPLRAAARLDAFRGDQAGRLDPAERAVDRRPRDMPDPAQVTLAGRQRRDGEAVGGLLADHPEHDPLGQRQRRRLGHAHRS